MHVFTVLSARLGQGEPEGFPGGGKGSVSRPGLKICVTGRITEMAEQKTGAVLPERRRAVVSGLLIVEARRKRGENGHMKG